MITIYYILIKKSIKKLQNMNYNIKKDESRRWIMRIRNKPWAKEELNASKFYVQNLEDYKGISLKNKE